MRSLIDRDPRKPSNANIPVRLTLTIAECALLTAMVKLLQALKIDRQMPDNEFMDTMALASLIDLEPMRRSILLAMDQAEKLDAATKFTTASTGQ